MIIQTGSNGESYTVLIPSVVKRECLQVLQHRGKRGSSLYYRLFAIGLFFLLRDHFHRIEQVIIDKEYEGHEAQIKEQLINLLREVGMIVEPYKIGFALIHQKGAKNPAAHDRAYYTHQGREKAGKVVTVEDLLRYIK